MIQSKIYFALSHKILLIEFYGITIDLADKDWNVVAKIVVTKFCCGSGKTTGCFRVVKIYDQFEKEFLTDYWRRDVEGLKAQGILTN